MGSTPKHWYISRLILAQSILKVSWLIATQKKVLVSVAEPPLFWAAPASEVRGLGADSSSDQIGSALALGKKGGSGSIHQNFSFCALKKL